MNRPIRDYDPAAGQAFQGDVMIAPIPDSIVVSRDEEIEPRGGRLILQEGEVTGHHHAITLLERPVAAPAPRSAAVDKLIADAQAGRIPVPTARLYRDPKAAQALVDIGDMTGTDLCIGFLVVENGPMVLTHEEHDGIRIPPGTYYVGGQVESDGAEERVVRD